MSRPPEQEQARGAVGEGSSSHTWPVAVEQLAVEVQLPAVGMTEPGSGAGVPPATPSAVQRSRAPVRVRLVLLAFAI